jgi:hypothetical protein
MTVDCVKRKLVNCLLFSFSNTDYKKKKFFQHVVIFYQACISVIYTFY